MKYSEILGQSLRAEFEKNATTLKVPKNAQIISVDDRINDIPFLVSGTIRVYAESYESGKEVLLYYLESGETCFMSIIAGMGDQISKVSAVTETDCELHSLPNLKVKEWQLAYSEWNGFILGLMVKNYTNTIKTIEELSFLNIESRLINYLQKHQTTDGVTEVVKTHQQIAKDLGTSREVITRVLKKIQFDEKNILVFK